MPQVGYHRSTLRQGSKGMAWVNRVAFFTLADTRRKYVEPESPWPQRVSNKQPLILARRVY